MVGNDIVDLRDRDADFATFSDRFDERVFAPSERRTVADSNAPEACRWHLWAAKEAAFKAARKASPGTVFSPMCFEVRWAGMGAREAEVRTETERPLRFEVRFFSEADSVHAVALCPGWTQAKVVHGCGRVVDRVADSSAADAPGAAARRLAVERLAQVLSLRPDRLEIRRDDRVPALYEGDRPVKGNLSLSHHGEWVAFAFESGVTMAEVTR